MNLPRKSSFTSLLILTFVSCLLCTSQRAAAGMMATRAAGVVQSIDPANKTIILQKTPDGAQLKLSWFWDTTFLADGKRAKPDALKVGTQVEVRYHSPLFGREYATSVEWHSATKPSARASIPAGAFSPMVSSYRARNGSSAFPIALEPWHA